MRGPVFLCVLLIGCYESRPADLGFGGAGGAGGGIAPVTCCVDPAEEGTCCEDAGPDVNVQDGDAFVIDGKVNNVSVDSGMTLFTENACVCGFLDVNTNGARVYVDAWEEGPALRVRNDTSVNANAYLYVQSGGLQVGNDFVNDSGGATLLEGDLTAAASLQLNSAALMCTMEGRFDANSVIDDGGELLAIGEPDIAHEIAGDALTGTLDEVSTSIADMLEELYPDEADGRSVRVHFDYDAATLPSPVRLPMLFQRRGGAWTEVGR